MTLPLTAPVLAWLAERRARLLRRHPERAGWGEVRALLDTGLAPYAAAYVCGELRAREVPPGLAHVWGSRHGVDLLALAVGAGLDADDLRAHLHSVAGLDVRSLQLFAELHRSPLVRVRALGEMAPWH